MKVYTGLFLLLAIVSAAPIPDFSLGDDEPNDLVVDRESYDSFQAANSGYTDYNKWSQYQQQRQPGYAENNIQPPPSIQP